VLARLLGRNAAAAPDQLGRYRILRLLGQGGMGAVFLAEDAIAHRQVALKFMKGDVEDARERFLREARAAAALEDDHVVRIYHVDEIDGVPYLVMPFLQGESLEARLRRSGGRPLPLAEVLQIGREAAAGLAAAHARGLIHRDIKPANLWLERKGEADGFRTLVLDFGLARPVSGTQKTQTGAVAGTPGYMAPEQADCKTLDPRADLFSLGCVLYRLAAGRPAFEGSSVVALLLAVATVDPPPAHQLNPQIPVELSGLIIRLLAKDPARRPASTQEVIKAIHGMDHFIEPDQPSTIDFVPKSATPTARSGISTTRGLKIIVDAALGNGRHAGCAITLAFVLIVALGTGLVWQFRIVELGSNVPPPHPYSDWKAEVDIRIWRGPDGKAEKYRLGEAGALPVYEGDTFRIEAQVTVPASAYLYLFWINTEGKVVPVYPWVPGKWGTRPETETPVNKLSLPGSPHLDGGLSILGDVEGMETLLLLARKTPWELDDAAIRELFDGLPPQRPVQDRRSAVWFENGRVVENDSHRKRVHFEVTRIDDPVLRLQRLLQERLRPIATFSSAVSFAHLPKQE
jgi:serine/threonine protein kinase